MATSGPAQTRPLGVGVVKSRLSPPARTAGWLIVGFGALVVLAAMMPWASFGPFSVSGLDGDGALTLVLGLVAASMAITRGVGLHGVFSRIVAPIVALLAGSVDYHRRHR